MLLHKRDGSSQIRQACRVLRRNPILIGEHRIAPRGELCGHISPLTALILYLIGKDDGYRSLAIERARHRGMISGGKGLHDRSDSDGWGRNGWGGSSSGRRGA